jgi:hypothetical protein
MADWKALPIVARCQKCGRGFVTLSDKPRPWLDPYTWSPTGGKYRPDNPVCGGEIVPLAQPEPNND